MAGLYFGADAFHSIKIDIKRNLSKVAIGIFTKQIEAKDINKNPAGSSFSELRGVENEWSDPLGIRQKKS